MNALPGCELFNMPYAGVDFFKHGKKRDASFIQQTVVHGGSGISPLHPFITVAMMLILVAANPRTAVHIQNECQTVLRGCIDGQIQIVGVVLTAPISDFGKALAVIIMPLGFKHIQGDSPYDE